MQKTFWYTLERHNKRTEQQAYAAWEQACRSRWRALYLIIKANREFFYDVVLPDGRTAGEFLAPQIEAAYETGERPPLLPVIK